MTGFMTEDLSSPTACQSSTSASCAAAGRNPTRDRHDHYIAPLQIVGSVTDNDSGTLLVASLVGEWERYEDDVPEAVGRHRYPVYSRS
jgi:hypothetical protein